jgi:uncharacterized membrane protein
MEGMISAFTLFVALHSIPAMPILKSRLVRTVGRTRYLIAYSTASTVVLVWLFYEALNTDYVELWEPAAWQVGVTLATAPLGLFLVITGLLSPNPFSVTLRRESLGTGEIVRITRHPVLWGFFLWAAGHVVPNGDLRSLILFGGFAAFSLGGIWMAERRTRRALDPKWQRAAAETSVVPLLALLADRRTPKIDRPMIIGALMTVAVTVWLLQGGHALIFGVDPITTLRAL